MFQQFDKGGVFKAKGRYDVVSKAQRGFWAAQLRRICQRSHCYSLVEPLLLERAAGSLEDLAAGSADRTLDHGFGFRCEGIETVSSLKCGGHVP